MAQQPIQIPSDILAKYDQPGQSEAFDVQLRKVAQLPPDRVAEVIAEAKEAMKNHKRGRPTK